jgi:hypothetical protein
MAMEPTEDIFRAIDKAVSGPSRSSLSRWMRQNYGDLFRRIQSGKPDWTALAAVFAKADLADRAGNPPTAHTARKTWERIRRELGTPKLSPTVQSPPATQPNPPVAQIIDPATRPPTTPRRSFAVSVPKKEI